MKVTNKQHLMEHIIKAVKGIAETSGLDIKRKVSRLAKTLTIPGADMMHDIIEPDMLNNLPRVQDLSLGRFRHAMLLIMIFSFTQRQEALSAESYMDLAYEHLKSRAEGVGISDMLNYMLMKNLLL